MPPLKVNDDARERLAVTQGALEEANRKIINGAEWYEGVRATYRQENAQ